MMKKVKILTSSLILVIGLTLAGCSLTDDTEDLQLSKLPNLESTDGNDGGSGGETPPPGN